MLGIISIPLKDKLVAQRYVNEQDEDGRTPLYFAVRNAHKSAPHIVRLLIGRFLISAILRDLYGLFGMLLRYGDLLWRVFEGVHWDVGSIHWGFPMGRFLISGILQDLYGLFGMLNRYGDVLWGVDRIFHGSTGTFNSLGFFLRVWGFKWLSCDG